MIADQKAYRFTATETEIAPLLPTRGKEWLNVSLWSTKRKRALNDMIDDGLAEEWYHDGEKHARLTLDGERLLRRIGLI